MSTNAALVSKALAAVVANHSLHSQHETAPPVAAVGLVIAGLQASSRSLYPVGNGAPGQYHTRWSAAYPLAAIGR